MSVKLIEEALFDHPDVVEVCALILPGAEENKKAKAFVAVRRDATTTAADLLVYCRARGPRGTELTEVEVLEELPRDPMGRVSRRKLLEIHAKSF